MRGTEGGCRDIFESKISEARGSWTHHSEWDERQERRKKKEKGRTEEKGEKKSGRDEEDKHDSRGRMLKVRMRSIPRIGSLSAEQTRRRRKREPLSSAKGD